MSRLLMPFAVMLAWVALTAPIVVIATEDPRCGAAGFAAFLLALATAALQMRLEKRMEDGRRRDPHEEGRKE